MTIVLVVDLYDSANNGTTISARNLVAALRERGNCVRVVAIGEPGEDKYVLPELYLPLATYVSHKQGMVFAKPVKSVLRKAFEGADIVHFYMPFMPLGMVARKVAREMNIPITGAFHVQPENITYNSGFKNSKLAAEFWYSFFKNVSYKDFTHLHCPSRFIAGELEKHGYQAKLHVISNGVADCFKYEKNEKPEEYKDKFCILMVGRLSNEKRQDILLEAARLSRHSKDIQLFFAGNGPKKKKYEELGETLENKPSFGFYSKEELKHLMSVCDLYVHTADAEIEAISCIEAFSSGLVPIISNSDKSATPQFALDRRSLFTAGNPSSLAEKIDYWFEHPDERRRMEARYSEHGKQFSLSRSAQLMEEMFKEAINEAKEESENERRSLNPGMGSDGDEYGTRAAI